MRFVLKCLLVLACVFFWVWFLDSLSGELQERYDCEGRGGSWIKDRCIERSKR